jgi:hypothetical protein
LQANVLGDESVECARLGDLCVVRFCLLALLTYSRNCIWAVEQPGSSIMPDHPRMQQLLQLAKQQKLPAISMVRLWMGLYGHFSAKATKLWGDASFAYTHMPVLSQIKLACSGSVLRPWLSSLSNSMTIQARQKLRQTGRKVTKQYVNCKGEQRCCGGFAAICSQLRSHHVRV